jgi:hypothetical protein
MSPILLQFVLEARPPSSYAHHMAIEQCSAVVLHGRDSKGNRAGLVPPRRCRRPATQDRYCGLHAKQAEVQDLLQECLSPMWESKVRMWEDRRRRGQLNEARDGITALSLSAGAQGMHRLTAFFRVHQHELAEAWAPSV